MATEHDDKVEGCLHCELLAAIDRWALAMGHKTADGRPDPDGADIAQGVGYLLAELTASCGSKEEAGHFFREVMRHQSAAYPAYRKRYRELDAAAEQPVQGIHGVLEAAVLKGKPN